MTQPPATKVGARAHRVEPRFVAQRYNFTCGPACLLMLMGAISERVDLSEAHEVDVWREATTAAPPGSSRYGLALAALRRGYRVRLVANAEAGVVPRGIDVEIPEYYERAELDRLLDDRRKRVEQTGVDEERRDVTLRDVEDALAGREKAMLLTSTEHFGEERGIPHWIAVVDREREGFVCGNPLDPEKRFRTLDPDALGALLGFGGEHEALFLSRPWWLSGAPAP